MRPKVSAAMIVRDEAGHLPRCLASLQGKVDEIVVVDTGSVDETVAIVRDFGARLLHFDWVDDFSAARNIALDAATGDWILYIDADETLTLPEGKTLPDLLPDDVVGAFVRFRPRTGFSRYREMRLFRADSRIRFRGRIHETMVPDVVRVAQDDQLQISRTGILIDHYGYDGDQGRKHLRNLPLLLEAVVADPDRIFLWHHLAETRFAMGDEAGALDAAQAGLDRARGTLDEKDLAAASMLHQLLLRIGLASGKDMTVAAEGAVGDFPEDFALLYLMGVAHSRTGDLAVAVSAAERLLGVDSESLGDGLLAFDLGIFGAKARKLAGLASIRLGRIGEAYRYLATDEPNMAEARN